MAKIVYTLQNSTKSMIGVGSLGTLGPSSQAPFTVDEDSADDVAINSMLDQGKVALVSAVPLKVGAGTGSDLNSAQYAAVVAGWPDVTVGPVANKYVGGVLTATLKKAIATGFQWYRGTPPSAPSAISGATNISSDGTSSAYTVQSADMVPGVELSVRPVGLVLVGSSGIAAVTLPSFVTQPVFSAAPQVGTVITYSAGTTAGNPTPTSTYSATVDGVTVSLPYTPISGDEVKTFILTQTATNSGGSASASISSSILAAPPGPVPVNSVLPAISGSAVENQTLTVTNGTWTNSPSSYTRQWKRGATNIGSGATTYVLVTADVGYTITCVVTAINVNGSATATSAATATVTSAPVINTKPVYFIAPANAYNTSTQTYLDGATILAGSSSGGKVGGPFTVSPGASQYGWVAVVASVSSGGVTFTDALGSGGWQGAGLSGNNGGASPSTSTSTTLFTDSNGTQWRLFRQDYANSAFTGSIS